MNSRVRNILALVAITVSGCASGTQTQLSISALDIKPPPGLESMPRVALGSFVAIHSQPQPEGEAGLNRFHLVTGGIEAKATVTSGPIGNEIAKAGGPQALAALVAHAQPGHSVPELNKNEMPELASPVASAAGSFNADGESVKANGQNWWKPRIR